MALISLVATAMITSSQFGTFEGSPVTLYTLKNKNGMVAKIMDFGATVVSLTAPDRKGKLEEVTLGFPKFDDYPTKSPYFGCTVGRVGNRIAEGKFTLDGKSYQLAINNEPNSLHGGKQGFDKRIWTVTQKSSKSNMITFKYVSKDGEENFPGELTTFVTYTLTADNALKIDYRVSAKSKTIQNLTNHTYFNLSGGASKDVLGHKMQILASSITPVDSNLIPTGKLMRVKDTPFDFNKLTTIGTRIDADDEQIKFGGGYDHNWVLKGSKGVLRNVANVHEPKSGRYMEVWTTEPGIQFYSGNFLDGTLVGHGGRTYNKRSGFCLETQHFPDSINQPSFPSIVLDAGKTYRTTTIYKFKAK
jgi:aldose 1-epimerase